VGKLLNVFSEASFSDIFLCNINKISWMNPVRSAFISEISHLVQAMAFQDERISNPRRVLSEGHALGLLRFSPNVHTLPPPVAPFDLGFPFFFFFFLRIYFIPFYSIPLLYPFFF
jgi:hypothetical protein